MGLFKLLTFIGAALGLVLIVISFGMSAPQQAAAAAVAIFLVGAPYCVHGVMFRSRKD